MLSLSASRSQHCFPLLRSLLSEHHSAEMPSHFSGCDDCSFHLSLSRAASFRFGIRYLFPLFRASESIRLILCEIQRLLIIVIICFSLFCSSYHQFWVSTSVSFYCVIVFNLVFVITIDDFIWNADTWTIHSNRSGCQFGAAQRVIVYRLPMTQVTTCPRQRGLCHRNQLDPFSAYCFLYCFDSLPETILLY